jgi:hypothetical protein
MDNQNKIVIQSSFPIVGILGIVFVTLKLTGHISWPWWLVTLPFLGWFALLAIFLVVSFIWICGPSLFRLLMVQFK